MKISNQKVVTMHYTLKNKQGDVLDSSEGEAPLVYIHGIGSIIPGLEKAMQDREPGDKFNVVIPPHDAYGNIDEGLIKTVGLDNFEDQSSVKVGVQFQLSSAQGQRVATVIKVEGQDVTLDLNHPLAGETLYFDVEVVNVRNAEKEELSHGHVHGEGGHHH